MCKVAALLLIISIGTATDGCSSSPVHYYTLVGPPTAPVQSLPRRVAVRIAQVHVPLQVDRRELVVRNSAEEVVILDGHEWASRPGNEIRDLLSNELDLRFANGTNASIEPDRVSLNFDVRRFDASLGADVTLEVAWVAEISGGAGPPHQGEILSDPVRLARGPRDGDGVHLNLQCYFRARSSVSPGFEGIVRGFRQQATILANQVADAVIRSAAAGREMCPE